MSHQVLSIESLKKKHPSRPRNPILADIFFKAGLIEAWGRGTIKIINECKSHNLPEPLFEINGGGICVTLFKKSITEIKSNKASINQRQQKAIEYVKVNGFITNSIYQEIAKTSAKTAFRDLEQLVLQGIFQRDGQHKNTKYSLISTVNVR